MTFTVGDETYIGTHRTVPVSFITNCKSDDSTCKFCQPLQSVTVVRTTIQVTITRGGGEIETQYTLGVVIENRNF